MCVKLNEMGITAEPVKDRQTNKQTNKKTYL